MTKSYFHPKFADKFISRLFHYLQFHAFKRQANIQILSQFFLNVTILLLKMTHAVVYSCEEVIKLDLKNINDTFWSFIYRSAGTFIETIFLQGGDFPDPTTTNALE